MSYRDYLVRTEIVERVTALVPSSAKDLVVHDLDLNRYRIVHNAPYSKDARRIVIIATRVLGSNPQVEEESENQDGS